MTNLTNLDNVKYTQRIKSVDFLRILCMFVVFLSHSWLLPSGSFKTIIGNGTGRALELFFIISGFFVTLKYKDIHLNTKSFFLHELKKLYPQYLIAHIIVFIFESIIYLQGTNPDVINYWPLAIKKLLISVFMLNSWIPDDEYIYAFNGVGWFLSSLMFCYFVTPAFLKRIKHTDNSVLLLFMVVTIRALYVAFFHFSGSSNWLYWISVMPLFRLFEYLSGMCLALIFFKKESRVFCPFVQILCISIFILAIILEHFVGSFGSLFICFELLLVVGWTFYSGVFDNVSGSKSASFLTKILMPFYFFHQIIIKIYKFICAMNSVNVYNIGLVHMLIMLLLRKR